MKSAVALTLALLSAFAVASHGVVHHHRRQCSTAGMGSNSGEPNANGWHQVAQGSASFTVYSGCQEPCKLCGVYFRDLALHKAHADPRHGLCFFPACGGRISSGYTAAVNTLSFGATSSFGDACGRCFSITPTKDPYSPDYTGPFGNTIVVKVNDLCPISGNAEWCSQTQEDSLNQFGEPMQCVLAFPY